LDALNQVREERERERAGKEGAAVRMNAVIQIANWW